MVRLERSVNRKKAEKLKQTVYKDMGTPTEQFIAVLAQRKVAEAARQDVKAAMDNHLALKISLVGIPEVWRRFRVPAATSLAKLHDHILTPIMGWSRSYHGFSRKCSCRKSRRGGRAGVVFFFLTRCAGRRSLHGTNLHLWHPRLDLFGRDFSGRITIDTIYTRQSESPRKTD